MFQPICYVCKNDIVWGQEMAIEEDDLGHEMYRHAFDGNCKKYNHCNGSDCGW